MPGVRPLRLGLRRGIHRPDVARGGVDPGAMSTSGSDRCPARCRGAGAARLVRRGRRATPPRRGGCRIRRCDGVSTRARHPAPGRHSGGMRARANHRACRSWIKARSLRRHRADAHIRGSSHVGGSASPRRPQQVSRATCPRVDPRRRVGRATDGMSATHRRRAFEVASVAKSGEVTQDVLLGCVEQPSAPLDRVSQRPMPFGRRTGASDEQTEPVIDVARRARTGSSSAAAPPPARSRGAGPRVGCTARRLPRRRVRRAGSRDEPRPRVW